MAFKANTDMTLVPTYTNDAWALVNQQRGDLDSSLTEIFISNLDGMWSSNNGLPYVTIQDNMVVRMDGTQTQDTTIIFKPLPNQQDYPYGGHYGPYQKTLTLFDNTLSSYRLIVSHTSLQSPDSYIYIPAGGAALVFIASDNTYPDSRYGYLSGFLIAAMLLGYQQPTYIELNAVKTGQLANNELIYMHNLVYARTMLSVANGLVGTASCQAPALTTNTVFNLLKNAVVVGTVTFNVGSTTGVFAVASDVSFSAGDRYHVEVNGAPDADLEGVSIMVRFTV